MFLDISQPMKDAVQYVQPMNAQQPGMIEHANGPNLQNVQTKSCISIGAYNIQHLATAVLIIWRSLDGSWWVNAIQMEQNSKTT